MDKATEDMLYANEMLKYDGKNNTNLVISALEKDPKKLEKIYTAEKTHKRLVKLGNIDAAKTYFEKA